MPSRRRTAASISIFEDQAILAQETSVDGIWSKCSLSLKFDQAQSQGVIGIRLIAEFEGFDDTQLITLLLPLENIEQLDACFDRGKIPYSMIEHLSHNAGIQSYDQVLILSLTMNAPGCVIAPPSTTILTPKDVSRSQVQAFRSLCQATKLLLYVPTPNLTERRRLALQTFASLACARNLTSLPTDLRRVRGGRGGRETTWEIFNIPELPPAYAQQAERATSKRVREDYPASQTPPPKKRLAGRSGAPSPSARTHVSNTDPDSDLSVLALSPLSTLLTPTDHSRVASPPRPADLMTVSLDQDLVRSTVRDAVQETLQDALRAELKAVLPDMLREVLPGMLRNQLPDILPNTLNGLLPEPLQDAIKGTLNPRFIRRSVRPLVLEHLPRLVRKYIEDDGTVDDYLDAAELQFREAAEDAVLDVKEAKDECITEIKNAEIDVVERLTGVEWNAVWESIMGLTQSQENKGEAGAKSETGRKKPEEEREEEKITSEEGTEEDRMSIPDAQRVEGLAPIWNRPWSRTGRTTAAGTEVGSQGGREDGAYQDEELVSALEETIETTTATGSLAGQEEASGRGAQLPEALEPTRVGLGYGRTTEDDVEIRSVSTKGGEEEGRQSSAQSAEHLGTMWMESEKYSPTEPNTEADIDSTGGIRGEGEGQDSASRVGGFIIRDEISRAKEIVRARRATSV